MVATPWRAWRMVSTVSGGSTSLVLSDGMQLTLSDVSGVTVSSIIS